MSDPKNLLTGKIYSLAKQFKEDGFLPYCRRGVLLVAVLMIIGLLAPKLPIFVIAIAVIGYALLSTCGQLFDIVIRRKHKQFKLEEEGRISRINRRWVISLAVCFIASSVSGILFILEAPRWGLFEWLFLWIAIPGFFIIYEIVRKRLSKEFKPWALKAIALRWSFIILTIFLCLAYAIIGTNSWGDYPSLEEAFQSVDDPFITAKSVLLSELSYVSAFTDGLTNYGLSILANEPNLGQVAIFVVRFISYAIIILGLASQYGACLLNKKEIESEFRLLPDTDEEQKKTVLVKRYFVLLGIITIVLFTILCGGENIVLELRDMPEYTPIKVEVDSAKQELILRIDKEKDLSSEVASNTDKDAKINDMVDDALVRKKEAINEYYDGLISVSDDYVNWYYDSFPNNILRLIKGIAADAAINQFNKAVSDSKEIASAKRVYEGAQATIEKALGGISDESTSTLMEFPEIANDENKFAEEYLIPKEDESREEFQNRLHDLINSNRNDSLRQLENFTSLVSPISSFDE